MKEICDSYDITQIVKTPTRGEYLLVLVLSSHADIKVKIGPKIADHSSLIMHLADSLEVRRLAPRRVWHYKDANWTAIKDAVRKFDVARLHGCTVDSSVELFQKFLHDLMHAHIPQTRKEMQKATLPWFNARCNLAIVRKHAMEDTPDYAEACRTCSQVVYEEKQKYKQKLKRQMEALPKSSKRWWSLMKRLWDRQASPSFFPPSTNSDGEWCRTLKAKADLFGTCWCAKNVLPPETVEHASFPVQPALPSSFAIRPRLPFTICVMS